MTALLSDWIDANNEPSLETLREISRPDVPLTSPDAHVSPDVASRVTGILRNVNKVHEQGDIARNRGHAIRLAVGWMEGLTFAEAAGILGVSEENLRRILHGELVVSNSRFERVAEVLELLSLLRDMVPSDLLAEWFRRPVPALGNQTPLESLRKRRVSDVLKVVRGYFDPSFS